MHNRLIALASCLGIALAVMSIALGDAAHADPIQCADGPTVAYSGSDDAADQLHALREQQAQDCHALVDELGQLRAVVAGTVNVDCGNCAGAAAHAGTDGDPQYVRLASTDDTAESISSRTDEAIVGFAGLLCGLFFGYLLYRQVMPRP